MKTAGRNLRLLIKALVITAVAAGCAGRNQNARPDGKRAQQRHPVCAVNDNVPYAYVGRRELPRRWYFRRLNSTPPLASGSSGLIYVMDLKCSGAVRYFSRDGILLGEIETPNGSAVAAGSNEYIYVFTAFGETREVRYYSPRGSFRGKWNLGPADINNLPDIQLRCNRYGAFG